MAELSDLRDHHRDEPPDFRGRAPSEAQGGARKYPQGAEWPRQTTKGSSGP